MVPLRKAIENGAWLIGSSHEDEEIRFQVKPVSFEKVYLEKLDSPEELETDIDSNIWILKISVINLFRSPMPIYSLRGNLILKDIENFEFHAYEETHLNSSSTFAKSSGLAKFWNCDLPAKVRKSGAFTYELPESFEEIFLAVKDGDLREV